MFKEVLIKSIVFSHLHKLTTNSNFFNVHHADVRQIQRHLSNEQLIDILINPVRIIRADPASVNPNGLPSYKIEGGADKHRIALQFIDLDENGQLTGDTYINIITVMDKQKGKKKRRGKRA